MCSEEILVKAFVDYIFYEQDFIDRETKRVLSEANPGDEKLDINNGIWYKVSMEPKPHNRKLVRSTSNVKSKEPIMPATANKSNEANNTSKEDAKTTSETQGQTQGQGTQNTNNECAAPKGLWTTIKQSYSANRGKLGFILGMATLYGAQAGVSAYNERKSSAQADGSGSM